MNLLPLLSLILAIIIILLSLGLFGLYKLQEKLIFYPETLPDDYQFQFNVETEEIFFDTRRNVKLSGLLFKAENSKGLIIYCHGNAGSIASWGFRAFDFLPYGYDVLLWDYRGYGKSTGKIRNEKVIHNDAEFVYRQMLNRYQANQIIFVGISLGTGIAARLAANHPSKLLMLITPYFNFKHTVDHHYPIIPTSIMLKYRIKTNEYLKYVKCPVYLIHGTEDETVPYESSVKLKHLFPDKVQLTTIEGGAHNNLPEYPQFQETVKNAFENLNS